MGQGTNIQNWLRREPEEVIFTEDFEDYVVDTPIAGQGTWGRTDETKSFWQVVDGGLSTTQVAGGSQRLRQTDVSARDDSVYMSFPEQTGTFWFRFNFQTSSAGGFFSVVFTDGFPSGSPAFWGTNLNLSFGSTIRCRIRKDSVDLHDQIAVTNTTDTARTLVVRIDKSGQDNNVYNRITLWADPDISEDPKDLWYLDERDATAAVGDTGLTKLNHISFRMGGSGNQPLVDLDSFMLVRNTAVWRPRDIWRDHMRNPTSDDRAISEINWKYAQSDGLARSNHTTGSNSGSIGVLGFRGFGYNSVISSPFPNVVVWKEGFDIHTDEIETICTYFGHREATTESRILIRIGSNWYVSVERWFGYTIGVVANFQTQSEDTMFVFTRDASAWRDFTFDGLEGAASSGFDTFSGDQSGNARTEDLPSGIIDAIGYYFHHEAGSVSRFDEPRVCWAFRLRSILGETDTTTSIVSGMSRRSPIEWNITTTETEVTVEDISASHDTEVHLYTDAGFSEDKDDPIALSVGVNTVYATVEPSVRRVRLHYKVNITRTA